MIVEAINETLVAALPTFEVYMNVDGGITIKHNGAFVVYIMFNEGRCMIVPWSGGTPLTIAYEDPSFPDCVVPIVKEMLGYES